MLVDTMLLLLLCVRFSRIYFFCQQAALQSGNIDSETGVDASFELVHEMPGKIRTGQWVGDCFLYTNEVRSFLLCLVVQQVRVSYI